MNNIRVAVAHIGARRYYLIPQLFYEAGILEIFYTDFFIKFSIPKWFYKFLQKLGINPAVAMAGRHNSNLKKASVKDYKHLGISFWWQRQRFPFDKRPELNAEINNSFGKKVLASKQLKNANTIYTFPGTAYNLFQNLGSHYFKVLDQNLAAQTYVSNLIAEEQERWVGWSPTNRQTDFTDTYVMDRHKQEWELADAILTPSDFVAESLQAEGVEQEKIEVIPYPVDLTVFPAQVRTPHENPLRVLFLGNVNLRKGIPYLLNAALSLGANQVQVRMIGAIQVARNKLTAYDQVATFLGRLPRSVIYQELAWTDILCLPSIAEGNSLATNEALASGVPVICTPNTGSRVRDGIDGKIVPIRDTDAIASALNQYIQDGNFLRWQSEQAIAGRDRLGYQKYRNLVINAIYNRFNSWN